MVKYSGNIFVNYNMLKAIKIIITIIFRTKYFVFGWVCVS